MEALANRPTHMDLLADFEANFDRAMLSIGGGGSGGQSGGEDAAEQSSSPLSFATTTSGEDNDASSSTNINNNQFILLAEIDEANSRIAELESINSTLQHKLDEFEKLHHREHGKDNATASSSSSSAAILRLELRATKAELEKWQRGYREAVATMDEMRLEVELANRSAAEANRRATYAELGMTVGGGGWMGRRTGTSSSAMRGGGGGAGADAGGGGGGGGDGGQSDSEYVAGLEAKVAALQEWALASAESKRLTAERCMELEERVRELELEEERRAFIDSGGGDAGEGALTSSGLVAAFNEEGGQLANVVFGSNVDPSNSPAGRERKLWTKSSSLVIGAGMVGHAILELGSAVVEPSETVILRWKFDITPADSDIDFSVLKGLCEDARSRRGGDACLRVRRVVGGGGGDVGGAFARQNACTMVWSNEMSWVRPRTVKWTAEAVAIAWAD